MQDIRKQFSLDWLVDPSERSGGTAEAVEEPTSKQPSLDEAAIFYSQPIMARLSDAPDHEMRLHDLARDVSQSLSDYSFEQFFGVIKYLAHLGIISMEDEDPTGNYLVKLLKHA